MLVDTRNIKDVKDARQGLDYTPSEHENDEKVFVFRITWEDEDEGDIVNFADTLKFVHEFPAEGDDSTEDDVRAWLDEGRAFRIGPDEDWYRIAPLPEPMKHNVFDELVGLNEPFHEPFEEPFDCRPGVDYPASL